MIRIITVVATLLGISHAEDCIDGERGIAFVENDMCLSAVTCANGATPVSMQSDPACPFKVSESSPCEGALLESFTKVNPVLDADVKCVRHLDCSSDQVQAKIRTVEECVDVPAVDFIASPTDATITFTVYHTIELELLGKFQLFGQTFLDNVIRLVGAHALGAPDSVSQITADTTVNTGNFTVVLQFPAGLVAAGELSRNDFGFDFESTIHKYQPFLTVNNLEVYQISAGQLTSINFWDAVVDPDAGAGQFSGSPDVDYNPTQDDDDTAIVIVIVVASVVFVCGAGVMIHHFRKKHKVVYADTSIDDAVAVSVSEGTYIAPTVEDNGDGLRVFKAKQDWSGEQTDSKFSSPLNFQRGDIIAAFEIDGIMHGYLRGAQPVDGSVEQVIRDGQFPKDAVEEVAGVQNYNNEFLWWAETSDDGKQYLHWVYIKGISMERNRSIDCDGTETTSTPRSDVFSTVELNCKPEELLALTLVSKLEELQREREESS